MPTAPTHQLVVHVHTVDLDDQQVQLGQVGRHPFRHALRRQRHEPARYRRLGHADALGRRNVAFRQPDGPAETACRHVDQHQVQRPLAEQVLGLGRLPARQGDLAAVASAHTGAFDLDLAPVKADLSLGLPPAVTRLVLGSAMAGAAQPRRILLHHVGQGGDACRQAEALEARPDLLPSLFDDCHRDDGSRCRKFLHGVALLVDSAPRAYWLKVSNACPPISTSTGTSPPTHGKGVSAYAVRWIGLIRRRLKQE
jgi:hypothetical protein